MAFVPLVFGVYWRRATRQGALAAIFLGLSTWLSMLVAGPADPLVPAQFAGLLASLFGMLAGSLLPQWVGEPLPEYDLHAAMHHRAAAHTQHVGHAPHRHG
jgi:Na+/proline symporter